MNIERNPLLELDAELLDWAAVRAEHVEPALMRLIDDAGRALDAVGATSFAAGDTDYDQLALAFDLPFERLSRAWGAAEHLAAVADSPAMRAAVNACLGPVTALYTRAGADRGLLARYRELSASGRGLSTPARRRAVELALRDFALSGADLEGPARERHAAILARLAAASQAFQEHDLDATDRFALDIDDGARLQGLPPDVAAACQAAAAAAGVAGWRLSLRAPVYVPAMQHLRDRGLRRQLHLAFIARASDLGPAELDNGPLIDEIVSLRQELAGLLGHASYAALSLVPKMAASAERALDFVQDLARRVRPRAEAEMAELRDFARTALGLEALEPWDIAFAAERLREARYHYSAEALKAYFPLPAVLDGLLRLFETLFDIDIAEQPCQAWHPSVRLLRVARRDNPSETIAHLWLDLHAREGKRAGAWMGAACRRWRRPGAPVQNPVAHLVCNFASAQGDRPALLTHSDLLTLLHEFGHALHHVLTTVDELSLAGTAGVEWDAVELPSLFMENFGWEWEVLARITAHVDTGAPLPRELFDRLRAARDFQTGTQTLRQLAFALFDLRLHHEAAAPGRALTLAAEVHAQVSVLPRASEDRYPCSFGHLFAGGYAAGYYSYKWAEVLSSDAWSAFEEAGVLDERTGRRYRREILETGGSRPAIDSFRAFRGREPLIDALLHRLGAV
jgi:oligopeptidase A